MNETTMTSDLDRAVRSVSTETLDAIAADIASAKVIASFAGGREGLVMKGLTMRLFHAGLDAHSAGEMTCPAVGEGDLLILSSGPGNISMVEALAGVATEAGARLIYFTAEPNQPAAHLADRVVVLKYSAWARRVLAIGGNEESAQLLGVQTTGTKVSVYVLSGLAAGLAGIVLASQTGSVSTDTGKGWELIAIAAVVVGGTLLTGGIGSVLGTLVGLLLMQLIFNVIVFENGRGTISISSYWESVIRGAFLLIVVLVQARVVKRRRR